MVNGTMIDKIGFLKPLGEGVSNITTQTIQFISNLGLNINSTTGKILSIVILLGMALGILKIVERPLKWAFIVAIIILIISIGVSLV